jgi:hypothetical protein
MKNMTFATAHLHHGKKIFAAPVAGMMNPVARDGLSVKGALGVIGLGGGFLLMASGLTVWAISSFTGTSLHGLDLILMICGFVFSGFGAHLLDLAEAENKAAKTGV